MDGTAPAAEAIGPAEVEAARERISGIARRTPLLPSAELSGRTGAGVFLKLETMQDTGAFKVRGAANAILALDDESRRRGVVTYSTGNHGRAVAHVAGRLGIPATVCVSQQVPPGKIEALARTGCDVRIHGASQDEAAELARRLEREDGLSVIDPVNDRHVIAGQGTIGLEIVDDMDDVDSVVVPMSGGGLISGIALAVKRHRPDCRVFGVSMDRGAAMHASQQAGHPVLVAEVESLADSLQGGILLDNRYTFAMVRDLVDDILLVDEERIAHAMAWAFWRERLILEGAAATPIAALLHGRREELGRRIALVLTGNAVDGARLIDLAQRHRSEIDGLCG